MRTFLAIDVASDRLTAGIVDATGLVAVRDRVATPMRDVWPAVHRLVRRVVAAKPDDVESPIACGVSCEGPIDVQTGTVTPLHLPVWQGFELRERARDLSGLPTVLGTGGVARVVAERWIGAAQQSTNVMAVLVSDAVEAGIISNGRLLRGGHGNLGHIGHVVVEPDGNLCPCGGQGCLMAYASSSAIELETDRPLRRTPTALVERTGALIGRAIASAVAAFDLRLVVLAGSVPTTLGAPLVDAARRELQQRSKLAHLRAGPDGLHYQADLELTRLGTEAPLVGAAGLARWQLTRRAPLA